MGKATDDNKIQLFSDESGIDGNSKFFAFGMLKTTASQRSKLLAQIKEIRQKHNFYQEIHFSKISNIRYQVYRDLLDTTLREINYKAIIVERSLVDFNLFDRKTYLAFNYYTRIMVEFFVNSDLNAVLYLDSKSRDKQDNGINYLYRKINQQKPDSLKAVEELDSKSSELMQLSDLYIGLIRFGYENSCIPFNYPDAAFVESSRKALLYHDFVSLVLNKRCKSRFKIWTWKPNTTKEPTPSF
jgi:hypothetical protein